MHAFAQQTPSTQKLDEHCTPSVQGAPIARLHAPDASHPNVSMPPPASSGPPSSGGPSGAASPASSPPPSPLLPGQPPWFGSATAGQSSIGSGTPSPSPSTGVSA